MKTGSNSFHRVPRRQPNGIKLLRASVLVSDGRPSSLILAQSSARLVEKGEHAAALEVLHHLVEIHPSSLDGPWQLANLHRVMGDTATAIRYYEECLSRNPNMNPARDWLERLRGGR